MTRFNNFITLKKDDEEEFNSIFIENLKKECAPYLKMVKGKELYRGIEGEDSAYIKKKVRTNRKPKDTPIEIHEYLDKELHRRFGWYPRSNGMFATSNFGEADIFGEVFVVFPVGPVKYLWNTKTEDIYKWLSDLFRNMVDPSWSIKRDWYRASKEQREDFMKTISGKHSIIDNYTNKGLQNAIEKEHEIVFNCKEYYGIEKGTYIKIKEGIFK